ncbi:M17 family peptidase N-terminal domain-containing protein [Ferruginibacter paludis]|uniref:M17 family peptidase N-terminal domain-containing protein n=1 Tax=Ferruginibacter paludis TaxID=1310417 RepID=UPI0025B3C671|nr:M17 family peptidase N-terminal domain-containing protein [Ferruginibacter paludis]MDN3656139.1 M17 family peptidase N-terminal domain-containing protein [Ferruginibacter paludis]
MANKTLLNPLNIFALVKGPGAVEADLVIAGFFEYEPGEPELIGGAKQLNDGLKGLVMRFRTDGSFDGKTGNVFLFKTPENTIPAKNVMLIGLGEKQSFNLDKVKIVGGIALHKAMISSFYDIAFAPEVRDAGVLIFSAAEVATAFTEGVMDEYKALLSSNVKAIKMNSFKILAGATHEPDAIAGIDIALSKYQA